MREAAQCISCLPAESLCVCCCARCGTVSPQCLNCEMSLSGGFVDDEEEEISENETPKVKKKKKAKKSRESKGSKRRSRREVRIRVLLRVCAHLLLTMVKPDNRPFLASVFNHRPLSVTGPCAATFLTLLYLLQELPISSPEPMDVGGVEEAEDGGPGQRSDSEGSDYTPGRKKKKRASSGKEKKRSSAGADRSASKKKDPEPEEEDDDDDDDSSVSGNFSGCFSQRRWKSSLTPNKPCNELQKQST